LASCVDCHFELGLSMAEPVCDHSATYWLHHGQWLWSYALIVRAQNCVCVWNCLSQIQTFGLERSNHRFWCVARSLQSRL
jgi:hypothetical protein